MLLQKLLAQKDRVVAGLMSGTSLDGVDVVIARLSGSGRGMSINVLYSDHFPYRKDLAKAVLANADPPNSSVKAISQLNVRLGRFYAKEIERTVAGSPISLSELDLVGSHGQTIYHVPKKEAFCGQPTRSTLQLGDTSVIANQLNVPTVGDFRQADMALEGEGAPLVPYFDYLYFTHEVRAHLLVNIGGIANLSMLPANATPAQVQAFDTGPGNMLIDGLTQHFFDAAYDKNGQYARQGKVSEPLMAYLFEQDDFLLQPPPKSTGRAHYSKSFQNLLIAKGKQLGCAAHDILATVTAFTARSIYKAYEEFIAPEVPADEVIVSGGGMHNPVLMDELHRQFGRVPVTTTKGYGIDPDLKEALCFAVLAHEFINGVPTNLPSVTGAQQPTLLGKLSLPG